MENITRLLRRVLIYLITLVIFAFIFVAVGYDSDGWNGLDEENDNTLNKKIGNRLYFTVITFSSIGYGDITPKSPILKTITCILALILIAELLTFVFDFKWRSVDLTT